MTDNPFTDEPGDEDVVEIFGRLEKETDEAVLLNDGTNQEWLPKSLITIEHDKTLLAIVLGAHPPPGLKCAARRFF